MAFPSVICAALSELFSPKIVMLAMGRLSLYDPDILVVNVSFVYLSSIVKVRLWIRQTIMPHSTCHNALCGYLDIADTITQKQLILSITVLI